MITKTMFIDIRNEMREGPSQAIVHKMTEAAIDDMYLAKVRGFANYVTRVIRDTSHTGDFQTFFNIPEDLGPLGLRVELRDLICGHLEHKKFSVTKVGDSSFRVEW